MYKLVTPEELNFIEKVSVCDVIGISLSIDYIYMFRVIHNDYALG